MDLNYKLWMKLFSTWTKYTGKSLEVPSTWTSDRLWAIIVVLVSNGDTTRQRDVRRQRYDVRCVRWAHDGPQWQPTVSLFAWHHIRRFGCRHAQTKLICSERKTRNLPIFGTCLSTCSIATSWSQVGRESRTFFVTAGNNPDTFMLMHGDLRDHYLHKDHTHFTIHSVVSGRQG